MVPQIRKKRVNHVQSILIIDPSDAFRIELEKELKKDYCVYSCATADDGLKILQEHRPDALVINLFLHGTDGLYFLESSKDYLPGSILTLSPIYPPYSLQRLKDLGVSYPLLSTCPVRIAAHRIRDILNSSGASMPPDAQDVTAAHLNILGIPHSAGYEDLRVGVPLFAQDPAQGMIKEFYPAAATLRGRNSWNLVERSIRDAKEQAYEKRNDAVWKEYFPDTSHCPKNKQFIARLAEFLK